MHGQTLVTPVLQFSERQPMDACMHACLKFLCKLMWYSGGLLKEMNSHNSFVVITIMTIHKADLFFLGSNKSNASAYSIGEHSTGIRGKNGG